MNKFKLEIFKNEELEMTSNIIASPEDILTHPMVPNSIVLVNKIGNNWEIITRIYLKESRTEVYLDNEKLIYFHSFSGEKQFLNLDITALNHPVGSFDSWVKGNLDVETYRISPID